ncbi:MAG: tetratricopeptide repeat protein [Spirochaetales bacterium]|nr:MAG: tetratricopeptide repeat protein [Spirochaetales bacterium]
MAVKELKRALKFLQARKYHEVLRLLEPQTFRFRESYAFYYFLGLACIHLNDVSGAATYLRRAADLKHESTSAKLGLAYLHLRKNETSEAIQQYLKVLEFDPGDKTAHQGLNMLKRSADSQEFVDYSESSKINALIPRVKKSFPAFLFILLPVLIITVFLIVYFVPKIVSGSIGTRTHRIENFAELTLPETSSLTVSSGQFTYILTEREIRDSYALAVSSFEKFSDNIAQREINRLLLSNASEAIKEKARLISSYLGAPTFLNYSGEISYAQAVKEPELYRNCYVKWKGLIGNLSVTDEKITFDLLVGYETQKVLEGVVPVSLPFAVLLHNGDPVEVIAKITGTAPFSLEGTAIRPIQP